MLTISGADKYPYSELPSTLKNLRDIVGEDMLRYDVIDTPEELEFEEFEELPFCAVYTDSTNCEHMFLVPNTRMEEENVDYERDQLYYYLAVVKASLAEDIGPLIASTHLSLSVPEDLTERFYRDLMFIELIRDVWALDILHEGRPDLWFEHITMLPGAIECLSTTCNRKSRNARNPKPERTIDGFKTMVLLASLSRIGAEGTEEAAIYLREMEELLLKNIKDEAILNRMVDVYSILAGIRPLTFDRRMDYESLTLAANGLYKAMGSNCRIKICREIQIEMDKTELFVNPSDHLIHIVPLV